MASSLRERLLLNQNHEYLHLIMKGRSILSSIMKGKKNSKCIRTEKALLQVMIKLFFPYDYFQ